MLLALNKSQLSRFHDHWFWGLTVAREEDTPDAGITTFYDMAQDLQNNIEQQCNIAAQLEDMSSSSWITRALYWFFNIQDYRRNYYALQSYLCCTLYEQKEDLIMKNNDKLTIEQVGGFLLISLVGILIFQHIRPSLPEGTWFAERLKPFVPKLSEVNTSNVPTENSPLLSAVIREQCHRIDLKTGWRVKYSWSHQV